MIKYIFNILLVVFVFLGCKTKNDTFHDETIIIKLSIDSTLAKDFYLNTDKYWIDFSKTKYFDRKEINRFLKVRNEFTEINSDSLLKNDSTWIKYGYLRRTLIRYKTVESKSDSLIIKMEKIKAKDGSIGIEIIMKKNYNYKVTATKIIQIS